MYSQYDENLQENPFFQEIVHKHPDLLNGASEYNWVICVPRFGTVDKNQMTIEDILDHILVPNVDLPDTHFATLSKKYVTVHNKIITPNRNDFNVNCIQILFQETFYVENSLKYTVWCIDCPFTCNCESYEVNGLITLCNLHDCIDFLWSESTRHEILEQIQCLCQNFLLQYMNFETEVLQVQKDLIGGLYSQCLQVTLKHTNLRNKINSSHVYLDNVKLAVETYMQSCLNNKLFNAIGTYLCHDDAAFNKIVCNDGKFYIKELNISNNTYDIIPSAKLELSKLNKFTTILGKINCLKRTFNALSSHSSDSKANCITSDELLQIFVFLITKMNINNWIANLVFIKEFRFSSLDMSDENSFLITSLEAAIHYIKNESFAEVYSNTEEITSHDSVKVYFSEVSNGNLEYVKRQLEKTEVISEDKKLCHPLCSCNECLDKTKSVCQIDLCDEKGQTALHVASTYGHLHIVEFLINCGAQVDGKDYSQMSPLHYAALRGHQDVLLYLVDSGAAVNTTDKDGNTPLHLAANNGHDRSVKALIYSPNVNVNMCNNSGNTSLHLASKWGYLTIVQILLEAEASVKIANEKGEKAQDLAQNYYIYKLLLEANNKINENKIVQVTPKKVAFVDFIEDLKISTKIKQVADYGIRPKSLEQIKKTDLLLKAVECNDLPLTCFYLGFPPPQNADFVKTQALCHPLCICERCQNSLELNNSVKPKETAGHININTCNANGYTPLHIAAKFGRTEILRLLLDSCALPNVKTYNLLYTPLHLACIYQRLQIVRELLKCGSCDFDSQDAKGNTPLHYACAKNDARIVELLLSHDADCTVKNKKGLTAWQEAQDKMFFNVIKLFEQNNRSSKDTNELFNNL